MSTVWNPFTNNLDFTGAGGDACLSCNNTWTGLNTFQNHVIANDSTDNTTFYPYLDQYYTGFLPHGRNSYGHETAASDNPDALHSYIRRSINQIPLGGSDDGTGCYIADQLELRYQGAAVTTITSITVVAGVGTFVVASTSALYKREGIAVRQNSNSTYNTYWIITGITNATTFTAVASSGTAATGSGNGGDIRAEANEWNAAASGYRYIYVYSHNGNPTQSGQMSVGYPLSVLPPTDFAAGGGNARSAFLIQGSQSTTSGAGGMISTLVNTDATSATAVFEIQNSKSGNNVTMTLDQPGTGADNFRWQFGSNFMLFTSTGGSRLSIGGSTDDGATGIQLNKATKVVGNLTGTGNATFTAGLGEFNQVQSDTNQFLLGSTGGQIQFQRTPANNASVTYSAFTQTANAGPSNTATETTLLGTGLFSDSVTTLGTLKFDRIGKTYRFKMSGFVTNILTPTLQIKVKVNSTTIFDTGAFTMVTVTGSGYWDLYGELTCRTTGATGTLMCQAKMSYFSAVSTANIVTAANTTATTVDISANRAFDITAQWGTANPSNVITATNFTLEQVN